MSYIGNSPGVASQRVETAFTATSNQTVFTPSSGYTLGYCDVYQNGVKLVNGDDYTASDGVTVTLATGAASGDSIVIVASFPRGLSDGYLKAEADAKYLTIANPSYTGTLTGGTGAITIGTSQFVKDSSGNIGIGTASPAYPLDITRDADTILRVKATNTGGGTDNEAVLLLDSAVGGESQIQFSENDLLKGRIESRVSAGDLKIVTETDSSMRIGLYPLDVQTFMAGNKTDRFVGKVDKTFSISGQETSATGLAFSPDGTRMYVGGTSGDDVNQYSLATAWDVSTATFVAASINIGDSAQADIYVSENGTNLYVLGDTGNNVRWFTFGTAWDISTITFSAEYVFSTGTGLGAPYGSPTAIRLSSDGYKMFVTFQDSAADNDTINGVTTSHVRRIYQFALSTAFNVTTATYTKTSSVLLPVLDVMSSMAFYASGTKVALASSVNDNIYFYTLGTAWDVGTMTYVGVMPVFDDSGIDGLYVNDSEVVFASSNSTDRITQFTFTSNVSENVGDLLLTNELRASGNTFLGDDLFVSGYANFGSPINVGYGTSSSSITARFQNRFSTDSTRYGIYNSISLDGSLTADRSNYGTFTSVNATFQQSTAFSASIFAAYNQCSTSVNSGYSLNAEGFMYGAYNYVLHQSDNATYTRVEGGYGAYNYVYSSGDTSLIDNAYGSYNYIRTGGTAASATTAITNAYGVYTLISAGVANRNIGTAYGHYFTATETGTITTKYAFYDNTTWDWRLGKLVGTGNRAVYSDANGILTNTSSDATLKTNVQNIGYGVETVKAMRPVSYNWIDTDKRGAQLEIGFIAQEMQEVVPEVIGSNSDGTLSLDYPKLVAVLTKAIQEQQAIIEQLQADVATLKGTP